MLCTIFNIMTFSLEDKRALFCLLQVIISKDDVSRRRSDNESSNDVRQYLNTMRNARKRHKHVPGGRSGLLGLYASFFMLQLLNIPALLLILCLIIRSISTLPGLDDIVQVQKESPRTK